MTINWIFSSTLVILVVLLLRALLKRKLCPQLVYALWAIAFFRLLVPFQWENTQWKLHFPEPPEQLQAIEAVDTLRYSEQGTITGYLPSDLLRDFPVVIRENATPEDYTALSQALELRLLAKNIWKFGLIGMVLLLAGSNLVFHHRLYRNRTRLDAVSFPFPVYSTDAVPSPCLVGILWPKVYLTREASQPENQNFVLKHEFTHLSHGDHLWVILRCVVLCLHWFNPLVWVLVLLSREDAERACDAGATDRMTPEQKQEYSRTLLRLSCQSRPRPFLAATPMIGSKTSLARRMEALAHPVKTKVSAVCLALLVLLITAGCSFFTAPRETPAPASAQETPQAETEADRTVLEYWKEAFPGTPISLSDFTVTEQPDHSLLYESKKDNITLSVIPEQVVLNTGSSQTRLTRWYIPGMAVSAADIMDAEQVVRQFYASWCQSDHSEAEAFCTEFCRKTSLSDLDILHPAGLEALHISLLDQPPEVHYLHHRIDFQVEILYLYSSQYPTPTDTLHVILVPGADGSWKLDQITILL